MAMKALQRLVEPIGRLVRAVSPRHRRWKRLLDSCFIDPDQLPRPLHSPSQHDFMICGASRSGTSLLCAALYQPPSVVTVMEPWDGMRLPPADLFSSLREEIDRTGMLRRGRLDVNVLSTERKVRWGRDRQFALRLEPHPDYLLGVKWPVFWRYLDLLPETRFLVCLRHPVEVINSFAKRRGGLAEGRNYDIAFNRKMNDYVMSASDDPAMRRIVLFDYIHSRLLPHLDRPNVFVVRYERWFDDSDVLLAELGDFLGVELNGPLPDVEWPKPPDLPAAEIDLIVEHCRTARPLGYPLHAYSRAHSPTDRVQA